MRHQKLSRTDDYIVSEWYEQSALTFRVFSVFVCVVVWVLLRLTCRMIYFVTGNIVNAVNVLLVFLCIYLGFCVE